MSSSEASLWKSQLGLLLRLKLRSLLNRTTQAIHEAPLRISGAAALITVIWLGLYFLFDIVLSQIKRSPLEAVVAIPMVFNLFFAAMLVLLTFSNAIIVYNSMFGKNESAYLLTTPIAPRDVVTIKFFESLLLASWSLILLGIPLMLAIARLADDSTFYVLFLGFFLAFIPIPAAMGMLLAWAMATFFPWKLTRLFVGLGIVALAILVIWALKTLHFGNETIEIWLESFQARLGFVQFALLPNKWVAAGIDHALGGRFVESLRYLGVTIANALFASWLAVTVVSGKFDEALDRATSGRGQAIRVAAHPSGGWAGKAFFYLPMPLRLVAAKDLRTFFRDPLQWTQLAILFGLLALYLTNMPTLRFQFSNINWYIIIPFLNLSAVSLILATFTCRFVFPLVSLEGHHLWLVGLLPTTRGRLLIAKLAFALTITWPLALSAMLLASYILELEYRWVALHLCVALSACFGLCSLSVGLGARLPMFEQTNMARIANGLGGTTNLLVSVAMISCVLIAVGIATWNCRSLPTDSPPTLEATAISLAASIFAISAGCMALASGAKHFNRIDI